MLVVPEETHALIRKHRTKLPDPLPEHYIKSLEDDYDFIGKYLPKSKSFFLLDVGGGLGGIDILIKKKHPDRNIEVTIIEEEGEVEQRGYEKSSRGFMFSRSLCHKMWIANNEASFLETWSTLENHKLYDVVISLQSMGFHYPIENYVDKLYEYMVQDGILIVDIREDKFLDDKRFIEIDRQKISHKQTRVAYKKV